MRLFKHRHGWVNLDLMTDAVPDKNKYGADVIRVYFAAVSSEGDPTYTVIFDPLDVKRLTELLDTLTAGEVACSTSPPRA